jgi:hypothetical protein
MRKIALIVAVLSLLTVVQTGGAQIVVNGDWGTGDETGWTRWGLFAGATGGWAVTSAGPTPPEGELSIISGTGDFGWYQVVDASPGYYSLDCMWAGDIDEIDSSCRCEVLFFTVPEGTGSGDIEARIRSDADGDIAYEKLNPWDRYWGWEPASLSPHPGGNYGTCVVSGTENIVVALRLSTNDSITVSFIWTSFDDITLTLTIPTPTVTPTNTATPSETPTKTLTPTLSTGIDTEEWRVYR